MRDSEYEAIRERERREEAPYKAIAAASKKAVTFTASDGCSVTVLPSGKTFYNAEDWY